MHIHKQVLEGYEIMIHGLQFILKDMVENRIICIQRSLNGGIIPNQRYDLSNLSSEESSLMKKIVDDFYAMNPAREIVISYKYNLTIKEEREGFNLTTPPDTHSAGAKPGTWRTGSQGWWVFLKPLPPGEHTISYNVRVTPTGALTSPGTNPHFADITYKLQVDK
jgi:hypothetical protein